MIPAVSGEPKEARATVVDLDRGEADGRPEGPSRIDRFVVLSEIGAGGMGIVYSAYDEELDRKVAIKLLQSDLADGTQGRSRLLREAQVGHEGVVLVPAHVADVVAMVQCLDGQFDVRLAHPEETKRKDPV